MFSKHFSDIVSFGQSNVQSEQKHFRWEGVGGELISFEEEGVQNDWLYVF